MLRPLAVALLAVLLSSCTGYQLGGSRPTHLASVRSIHVAIVENQTQIPRAAAHATNTLIDALTRDGTYRVAKVDHADTRLVAVLEKINYRQARSAREDILRSEELEMEVFLQIHSSVE